MSQASLTPLKANGSEWTFEDIAALDKACAVHAARYGLDYFPNQIEVITSEQMLDAYSAVGLPVNYAHWSFGKDFLANEKAYKKGQQGLAYEIVINSNPCISYLMEGNSLAMQALVIAHACYGHNSFFKGNYIFQQWTQPDAIVDYMVFDRNYVAQCEERYGFDKVEETLDALHALSNHGVDKYQRPGKLDARKEREEQAKRLQAAQEAMRQNEYYSLAAKDQPKTIEQPRFPLEPQENLLYFVEKHSPTLQPWQRELTRIVRKIAQYFYPQRQTKVMNEGWATFWHLQLLSDMWEQGQISDGMYMECLHSHSGVVAQRQFGQFNPYSLGLAMYRDIQRICTNPTVEDKHFFPDLAGRPWLEVLKDAMQNYRDESFVLQFLSPKVVRDFQMMHINTHQLQEFWVVEETASEEGFYELRRQLSKSFRLESMIPEISVQQYYRDGDRTLLLKHTSHDGRALEPNATAKVLKHLQFLWGYDVLLETDTGVDYLVQ